MSDGFETFDPNADRVPGRHEAKVLETMQEGYLPISIEHRGPDATEVLALLIFNSCRLCGAVLPPDNERYSFGVTHLDWHLEEAFHLDLIEKRLRA